jgi:hypothetical protein
VINYFFLMAEEIREIMARLGFRRFDELIGRTDKIRVKEKNLTQKESSLNYEALLFNAQKMRSNQLLKGGTVKQSFDLEK